MGAFTDYKRAQEAPPAQPTIPSHEERMRLSSEPYGVSNWFIHNAKSDVLRSGTYDPNELGRLLELMEENQWHLSLGAIARFMSCNVDHAAVQAGKLASLLRRRFGLVLEITSQGTGEREDDIFCVPGAEAVTRDYQTLVRMLGRRSSSMRTVIEGALFMGTAPEELEAALSESMKQLVADAGAPARLLSAAN